MQSRPRRPRSSYHDARRRRRGARIRTVTYLTAGVLGVLAFTQPAKLTALVLATPVVREAIATPALAGMSHAVELTMALPGDAVHMPMDLGSDSLRLRYAWVAVGDTVRPRYAKVFDPGALFAPAKPGFYHLALFRDVDTSHVLLDAPTLAVLMPFSEKRRGAITGYRIGTYRGERWGSPDHPAGFMTVEPEDMDLPVSAHLRVSDFVTHDWQQRVWPKYVALNPRLLDKLELVMTELERRAPRSDSGQLEPDVHSGFRTPLYNRTVPRAADDSRHQFGDAADITLDVNGDGRITRADIDAIVQAVDTVEAAHPDLVGGLGIYTSRRYPTPYVHIDTRGERQRWHG